MEMGKVYIYLRVSKDEQDIETQMQSIEKYLKQHNITEYEVFRDEGVSGGIEALKRPGFKQLYEKLQEGDIVIFSELTRLGRNITDVILTLDKMIKEKGVRIISVKEGLDSTNEFYFKTMSTFLAIFAELEREFIRRRTKEGLEKARREGKHIGRPYAIDEVKEKMLIEYLKKGYAIKDIAKLLGVSRSTIYRHLDKMKEEGRLQIKKVIEVRK